MRSRIQKRTEMPVKKGLFSKLKACLRCLALSFAIDDMDDDAEAEQNKSQSKLQISQRKLVSPRPNNGPPVICPEEMSCDASEKCLVQSAAENLAQATDKGAFSNLKTLATHSGGQSVTSKQSCKSKILPPLIFADISSASDIVRQSFRSQGPPPDVCQRSVLFCAPSGIFYPSRPTGSSSIVFSVSYKDLFGSTQSMLCPLLRMAMDHHGESLPSRFNLQIGEQSLNQFKT